MPPNASNTKWFPPFDIVLLVLFLLGNVIIECGEATNVGLDVVFDCLTRDGKRNVKRLGDLDCWRSVKGLLASNIEYMSVW